MTRPSKPFSAHAECLRRGAPWDRRLRAAASILVAALAIAGTCSSPASAREREFGMVVRQIESSYHVKRSHPHLMALAGFVVRVWRPYGVSSMKLALFEEQDFSAAPDGADFASVVQAALTEGWRPLVQVYSRQSGERTVVFAREAGKDLKLLVASVESNEAVVVQFNLNPDKLVRCLDRWTEKPDEIGGPLHDRGE